jgi:hypothetical protein
MHYQVIGTMSRYMQQTRLFWLQDSLLEKTGPQHKGDGKFRHPYTVDSEAQSLVLTDFSDRLRG